MSVAPRSHCPTFHPMRFRIAALALLTAFLVCPRADAQLVALHAVFVPGGDDRRPATGAEGEIGGVVSTRYLALWPSLAVEYQRQHSLGPGRGRLAGQLRVLPRSYDGRIVPYLGVSLSANQSGGEQSESGREVSAGELLLELSNPDLQIQTMQAEQQVRQAQIELLNLRTNLRSQLLTQQGVVANTHTQYVSAMQELTAADSLV